MCTLHEALLKKYQCEVQEAAAEDRRRHPDEARVVLLLDGHDIAAANLWWFFGKDPSDFRPDKVTIHTASLLDLAPLLGSTGYPPALGHCLIWIVTGDGALITEMAVEAHPARRY